MARTDRTPRPIAELIRAIDDRQYLLRKALHGLKSDRAHIKSLAIELRVLTCLSSGTEGLLWRVADELGVSDIVDICAFESVKRDAALNQGLAIWQIPLFRPGEGPPIAPVERMRLRHLIKKCEGIYVARFRDEVFTHERLILAIAGQLGAHEAEGLDESLVKLNQFLINGTELYFRTLATVGELTLQVGERVLDHAQQSRGYQRVARLDNEGDISLCVRIARVQQLGGRQPVFVVRSPVSEAEITFVAGPQSCSFVLAKRGSIVADFALPDPCLAESSADMLFTWSYSSVHRQARTVVNDQVVDRPTTCDFGWLDACEFRCPELVSGFDGFIVPKCIPLYARLISPNECGQLLSLPIEGGSLFERPPTDGPFPA